MQASDDSIKARDQDRTWVPFCVSLFKIISFDGEYLFRTNNATHLEEKNILLFIQKSEELLSISKIFGSKGEKVFRKFENSWIVLNAIAKLSKHTHIKLTSTQVNPSNNIKV